MPCFANALNPKKNKGVFNRLVAPEKVTGKEGMTKKDKFINRLANLTEAIDDALEQTQTDLANYKSAVLRVYNSGGKLATTVHLQ